MGTLQLRSLQRLGEAEFLDDFRVNALGCIPCNGWARPMIAWH